MFNQYVQPYDPVKILSVSDLNPSFFNNDTIKIGVSANLGGHTRELCAGISVALEKWMLKQRDYNVQILWEECTLDKNDSIKAANSLIARGADVIIGHLSATQALYCLQVYGEAGIPFLAPGTSHPDLTRYGYKNVLRFCGLDTDMAQKMIEVVKRENAKKITLIYENKEYGEKLGSLLTRNAKKETTIDITQTIKWDQVIKEKLENKIILFAGRYELAIEVIKYLEAIGFKGMVVLGDDSYISDLLEFVNEVNEDIDIRIVSTPLNNKSELFNEFQKAYIQKADAPLGAYSITSYAATKYLLQSLDQLKHTSLENLISHIKKIATSYEDPLLGKLEFTSNGDPWNFKWIEYKLEGGEFKKIEE
ncbi:ABC transporter substrate-binding protein [Halobacillus sp. B23F22_1]|uniref:ABC transporter substrate-binding protein n=1 Tax=Halobacillus sp. B23F22_1 TaxID=3459514 RepID=UPI00373FAD81